MSDAEAIRTARDEMDKAIRNYADVLWTQKGSTPYILGDIAVVANFIMPDKIQRNSLDDIEPSSQYILLHPRPLASHTLYGIFAEGQALVDGMKQIQDRDYYPEDYDE